MMADFIFVELIL